MWGFKGMSCAICNSNVYVLGGPGEYVFYTPYLVCRDCHEGLLARYGVVVGEEAIV
jgi:hypothetical protein